MSNPWSIPGSDIDMSDPWGMDSHLILGLMGSIGGSPYIYMQPQRPFGQPRPARFFPTFTGGGDFGSGLLGPQGARPYQNPWVDGGSAGFNSGAAGRGSGLQPAESPGRAQSISSSLPSGSRPGEDGGTAGSAQPSRSQASQGGDIPRMVGRSSRGGEGSIRVGESATSLPPGSVAGSRSSRRSRASGNPGTVVSGATFGDGPAGLHGQPGAQARHFDALGFPRGRRGRRGAWS